MCQIGFTGGNGKNKGEIMTRAKRRKLEQIPAQKRRKRLYREVCPECNGDGKIIIPFVDFESICAVCNGRGSIKNNSEPN